MELHARLLTILAVATIVAGCGASGNESFKMTADRSQEIGMSPISFRFDYSDKFQEKAGARLDGERQYVVLVAESGGKLLEQVSVGFLKSDGSEQVRAAELPILMERYKQKAERTYPGYRFLQEGWTKVGGMNGYQLFFTARSAPVLDKGLEKGKVQGRLILVPRPGLSGGVVITAIAGRSASFKRATQVGVKGLSAKVLDSFRFGS